MMTSDRLHTIMNGIAALLNGGISVYFIYKIARHMMKPAEAYEYTKMLLFAGLGTIPIVFFTMMFAGKNEFFNAFGLPSDMSARQLKYDETIHPRDALRKIIENHVRLTLGERQGSMLLFDVGLGNLSKNNKRKIINLRDEYDEICRVVLKRGI